MSHGGFHYHQSALHCDRVSLAALVKNFGTPLYVYSAEMIRERFRAFDREFRSVPHTVCYSVKASSTLGILRLVWDLGSGFDVVSSGELARVRKITRRAPGRTVFSGVGKTADEIDAALSAGILLFNVESESELHMLAERAARSRRRAPLAFRVNPDVPAETHPYISTGLREHKFGVPIEDARRLYALAARHPSLDVAGVSVHIGSQITDVRPFELAMRRVAELVRDLRSDRHGIRYVDAGGGLGIPYQRKPSHDSLGWQHELGYFSDYARAITRPLRGLKVHLLLEPGRVIVGPAGALVTRVLYRKQNGTRRFIITDAAMNDLIRPSLYSAHHEIVPVHRLQQDTAGTAFDVAGPVCETGDFFARDRSMPQVGEGELLAILDAGAYGMSLASNYNTRPRPAEVMVHGSSVRVIRKREKLDDLIRNET
ncbi:MAG: diaminopimelate decarboxylase [Acidobacteria bacterium]|nr:diaminopimelate decarboxylase [Acidobacteriota bacterium]